MSKETTVALEADYFAALAHSKIQFALAKVQQGQLDDASIALQSALTVAPDNRELLVIFAEVALFQGRLEQAINALISAIELDFRLDKTWSLLMRGLAAISDADLSLFAFLRDRVVRSVLPADELKKLVDFVLRKSGYDRAAPTLRVRMLFEQLVLPWLKWALDTERYALALHLEAYVHDVSVKQIETEENFREIVGQLVEPMRAAGKRVSASLPKCRKPDPAPLWKVTLILHSASMLAHVRVMLGMLDGYSRLDAKPIEFNVVCISGRSSKLEVELSRIGVSMDYLDELHPEVKRDSYAAMLRLREYLGNLGSHAVVWVSVTLFMPFAFSLRLAPVQIWWAMKYHSLSFDEIDGYLTCASFAKFVTINNRTWRSGRSQVNAFRREGIDDEVMRIRRQISGGSHIILGTLAREEKIASPAFMDAVCALLRKHDDAVYVWTGREKNAYIRERLIDAGVLHKTMFLGWIDTSVYAQVVDVFLDTFPAGCGFTVWEAMAAGKPVVFMASDGKQENISLDQIIWPLLKGEDGSGADEIAQAQHIMGQEGNSLYLRAQNLEEYMNFVSQLICDEKFRTTVGHAGRQFVTELMCNPKKMGSDYRSHFVELLAENMQKAV